MQTQTVESPKPRVPLNGVDTPNLFATINAVGNQPELARFQSRDEPLKAYEQTRDELALPQFLATDLIVSCDWDLETVQGLHKTMSEGMAREVLMIRAFAGTSAQRPLSGQLRTPPP